MDAASIEQMNKVRISLGMAPLPMPGANGAPSFKPSKDDSSSGEESEEDLSTLEKREAAASGNWAKLEAERQEKLERQKRKEAAKKARDSAQRYAKLEGKGLGDEDEDGELDTRAWLLGQKKRQKKIDKARKLEEQLAEQEREQQMQYTSRDLQGVRVAHEVDEFDDAAGEQILTLKDAEIGEESEDDELENADLKAREKLKEKLELLKRKPDYDPTEDNRGVLSKYDEEIEGKKQKRFTLDGQGTSETAQRRAIKTNENDGNRKRVKIDLDMLKEDAPISDYVDPSTIKVKKPKKSKKEKKTRKKEIDEDDIPAMPQQTPQVPSGGDAMDVDGSKTNGTAGAGRKRGLELDDDDDLQFQLAEQRRAALKKRKKTDAAELARQMREEMPVDEAEQEDDGGLVIDETREFVENLKKPDASEPQARESKSRTPVVAAVEDEDSDADGDTKMESYADEIGEATEGPGTTPAPAESPTATGLDAEDTVSGSGLGSALNLLRKRGIVNDTAAEKQVAQDRARDAFLASKQSLIDEYDERARRQREAERATSRWQRMSNRERDDWARKQNEDREKYLSRLLAEQFNKEYKPDVRLRYHDEFGREMNAKDAFKHLSHMFHGKGSGKLKTEKRLKKIEDERKEQGKGVLNVGDEEGGIAGVGGREGKRRGQAGVRLQ